MVVLVINQNRIDVDVGVCFGIAVSSKFLSSFVSASAIVGQSCNNFRQCIGQSHCVGGVCNENCKWEATKKSLFQKKCPFRTTNFFFFPHLGTTQETAANVVYGIQE